MWRMVLRMNQYAHFVINMDLFIWFSFLSCYLKKGFGGSGDGGGGLGGIFSSAGPILHYP